MRDGRPAGRRLALRVPWRHAGLDRIRMGDHVATYDGRPVLLAQIGHRCHGVLASSSNIDGAVVSGPERCDRGREVGATYVRRRVLVLRLLAAVHRHTYARPLARPSRRRRAFMACVGAAAGGCRRGAIVSARLTPVHLAVSTPASAFRAHIHRRIVARTIAVVVYSSVLLPGRYGRVSFRS